MSAKEDQIPPEDQNKKVFVISLALNNVKCGFCSVKKILKQ
jgi:hypothetical protein